MDYTLDQSRNEVELIMENGEQRIYRSSDILYFTRYKGSEALTVTDLDDPIPLEDPKIYIYPAVHPTGPYKEPALAGVLSFFYTRGGTVL